MSRERLPNRRDSELATLIVGGREYTVAVSFDPRQRVKELFLDTKKYGSEMSLIVKDIAVVVSVAVQDGSLAKKLARSVARLPNGSPATIVGAALDFMISMSPGLYNEPAVAEAPPERVACKGAKEYSHK